MKEIIFILILFSLLFSEKLEITIGCNVRDKVPFSKSKIINQTHRGYTHEIIDTWADWIYVEILDGEYRGKVGYMWQGIIKYFKGDDMYLVIKKGGVLREKPNKNSKVIYIKKNTQLGIIKRLVNWYKIRSLTPAQGWTEGWVCSCTSKLIKE